MNERDAFEYARAVLSDGHRIGDLLEQKALRLMTFLTLLVGAVAFVIGPITSNLLPPKSTWAWVVVGVSLGLLIAALGVFIAVWSATRMRPTRMLPLDEETVACLLSGADGVFEAAARQIAKGHDENWRCLVNRSKYLKRAHDGLLVCALLASLDITTAVTYRWSERSIPMTEENNAKTPAASAPAAPSTSDRSGATPSPAPTLDSGGGSSPAPPPSGTDTPKFPELKLIDLSQDGSGLATKVIERPAPKSEDE